MTATENKPVLDLASIRQLQQEARLEEAETACREYITASPAAGDDLADASILLALIVTQRSGPEVGKDLLAALPEPQNPLARSDRALLHLLMGEVPQARTMLEEGVLSSTEADHTALARMGSALMLAGDFNGAERYLRQALERAPEHPNVLNNLAAALLRQDKADEAIQAYEAALRQQPDSPVFAKGRTAAMLLRDRADELLDDIDSKLEQEPDSVALLSQRVQILLIEERFEDARDSLRRLTEIEPEQLSHQVMLASLYLRQDQYRLAIREFKAIEQDFPDKPEVLSQLARAYSGARQWEKALQAIERALELVPDMPMAMVIRAAIHTDMESYEQAEQDLRKVLETYPGHGEAWGQLGQLLLVKGEITDAVEAIKRAAEINPSALASLVEAREIPDDPKVVEQMQKLASHRLFPSEARTAMNFALIKVFEKQHDYATAFLHANQANALVREKLNYKPEHYHKRTDVMIEVFTPELFRRFEGLGNYSERPVFVVGMPRSGTTLTEQILSAHPAVFGAGELDVIPSIIRLMPKVLRMRRQFPRCMAKATERTIAHAAEYYLQALEKRDTEARRVVDKLPHNFLNLGLIAILFPHAKIIHVKRDLRDIAISNYFINFKMKRGGMGYSFGLAEIGHMLNDYRRIMDYWRKVLPIQMYEFNYEDLVNDTEKYARELIEYVDLEWDSAMMDFYAQDRAVRTASVWQVRQPIYKTSKARWKNYEQFLGPLEAVLEEYENA